MFSPERKQYDPERDQRQISIIKGLGLASLLIVVFVLGVLVGSTEIEPTTPSSTIPEPTERVYPTSSSKSSSPPTPASTWEALIEKAFTPVPDGGKKKTRGTLELQPSQMLEMTEEEIATNMRSNNWAESVIEDTLKKWREGQREAVKATLEVREAQWEYKDKKITEFRMHYDRVGEIDDVFEIQSANFEVTPDEIRYACLHIQDWQVTLSEAEAYALELAEEGIEAIVYEDEIPQVYDSDRLRTWASGLNLNRTESLEPLEESCRGLGWLPN